MTIEKLDKYESYIYYKFKDEIDPELEPEYIFNLIKNDFNFIYDENIKWNTKYKLIDKRINEIVFEDIKKWIRIWDWN